VDHAGCQLSQRVAGHEHAPERERDQGRIAARQQRGLESGETDQQPTRADQARERQPAPIELARAVEVVAQREVFVAVAIVGGFLHESGLIADHALDQIVRHVAVVRGPALRLLDVAPGQPAREPEPGQQQRGVWDPAGTDSEAHERGQQPDQRHRDIERALGRV
jgi:hypothetical protein